MNKVDIQPHIIILGIKVQSFSTEKDDYGDSNLFQVQLGYIFRLAEDNMNMQVWKYNDKYYLKVNQEKVDQYGVDKHNGQQEGEIEMFSLTKACRTLLI